MKNLLPLLLILLCGSLSLSAQQTRGVLQMEFSPAQTWARLDTLLLPPKPEQPQTHRIYLPPGSYRIELWAKGFLPHSDTVVVEADKATVFNYGFQSRNLDPEYVAFRKANNNYTFQKYARNGLVLVAVGTTVAVTAYTFSNPLIEEYEQQTLSAIEQHRNAVAVEDVVAARALYDQYLPLYEDAQKTRNLKLIAGIPAALATGATAYWLFQRFRNRPLSPPSYPDKNPFVFTPLLLPHSQGITAGFCLQF